MSHTMKLWKREIENQIKAETLVLNNQFGFMPERSAMEAIYLVDLRQKKELSKDIQN